jgi:phenylacetate-CoA ligase
MGFELVEHLEIPPNGKDRIVDQNISGVSGTWA